MAGQADGDDEALSFGVVLRPRTAFGSTTDHAKCIAFSQANSLVTCVGRHLHFYNLELNASSFLHVDEPPVLRTIAVVLAPGGKYAALLQSVKGSTPEQPMHQVAIYSLKLKKLSRTIRPESGASHSTEVRDFAFSDGLSKNLLVIWGRTDPVLITYRWYSGHVIGRVKEVAFRGAAFDPSGDVHITAISANALYSLEQDLKGETYHKRVLAETQAGVNQFSCTAFAAGFQIAGDDEGYVHCYQNGALIASVNALSFEGHADDDEGSCGHMELLTETESRRIVGLAQNGRGIVVISEHGLLALLMPGDQPGASRTFQLQHLFRVPGSDRDNPLAAVTCAAAGGLVAVATSHNEVYTLSTSTLEKQAAVDGMLGGLPTEDDMIKPFKLVRKGAHRSAIVDMSAAALSSLFITAGSDHMLRLCDAHAGECIAAQSMADDVRCVALHPLGSLALVGLHSRVKLFQPMLNQFVELRDFPVSKASALAFSNGGQFFAMVGQGSNILVYDTLRLTVTARLKGHVATVTALRWSQDDTVLLSTSSGGATYFWDVKAQERCKDGDYVDKASNFQGLAISADGLRGAVADTNGTVSLISQGVTHHSVTSGMPPGRHAPICLVGNQRIMLLGTSTGAVQSWPWPTGTEAASFCSQSQATPAHGAPLCSLVACAGESMLLTAAEDGTVVVWDMTAVVSGEQLSTSWTPQPVPGYTVPRADLKKLVERAREIAEAATGAEAEALAKAAMHTRDLQDQVEVLEGEAERLAKEVDERMDELDNVKRLAAERQEQIMHKLESTHLVAVEQLECTFEKRLELERTKLKVLQAEKDDAQFIAEEVIERMKAKHSGELEARMNELQEQLSLQATKTRLAAQEKDETEREYTQVLEETENDFEDHAERLKLENELAAKQSKEEIEDLNAHIHVLMRDNLKLKGEKLHDMTAMTKLKKANKDLEAKLASQSQKSSDLQRSLHEQKQSFDQSQVVMDELRAKVSELETVGFVMTDRAQRFADEVQPRRLEVAKLAAERKTQDAELQRALWLVDTQKGANAQKEAYIKNMKSEVLNARSQTAFLERKLHTLQGELASAMELPDDAAGGHLSERAVALHALTKKWKAARDDKVEEDDGAAETLRRQLMVTEVKAEMAEFRTTRATSSARARVASRVRENADLLAENAALRRDGKHMREQLAELRRVVSKLRSAAAALGMREGWAGAGAGHTGLDEEASNSIGPQTSLTRAAPRMEPIPEDAGIVTQSSEPALSGVRSLGSAVAPSRPLSSSLSRPRSAQSRPRSAASVSADELRCGAPLRARRPRSARPASASELYSSEAGPLPKWRPKSGTVAKGSPARILNEMVCAERERVGSLMTELESSMNIIESQQAQLNVLKGLVVHTIEEGDDAEDEVVFQQASGDEGDSERRTGRSTAAAAGLARPESGGRKATGGVVRPVRRPVSATPVSRDQDVMLAGRLRPTSAGGVSVATARQRLMQR